MFVFLNLTRDWSNQNKPANMYYMICCYAITLSAEGIISLFATKSTITLGVNTQQMAFPSHIDKHSVISDNMSGVSFLLIKCHWKLLGIFSSPYVQQIHGRAVDYFDTPSGVAGLKLCVGSQIAKFMGPTWGLHGSCRPQTVPMLAPWTLLPGLI